MSVTTVQQNAIRAGYKRTQVGLIPEDWDVKQLGDIGECFIGLTYDPSSVRESGLLVLRASNIADGDLRFDDNVYVDVEVPEKIMVRKDDILICVRSGSRDLIGKCALIDERATGMTFGAFMAVFRTKHARFVFQAFQSELVKRQIYEHIGATINQITNKNLRAFEITLPRSEEEEDAISGALADVDALIAALDRLIAKKRAIKAAAMQQLLTGKQRLSGFSGEWESVYLGDKSRKVGSGITPTGGEHRYRREGRPFLRSQNVGWGSLLLEDVVFIDDDTHRTFQATEIESGDVCLTITGASIGRSAVADVRVAGGNVNQHVCLIRTDQEQLQPQFLNYVLLSSIGQRQIDSFQAGGNRQGLNFGQIRSFQIPLPPLPEQSAIASVLFEMDAEVAALEARRAKTHALKQGMMQELLTGRIRLI